VTSCPVPRSYYKTYVLYTRFGIAVNALAASDVPIDKRQEVGRMAAAFAAWSATMAAIIAGSGIIKVTIEVKVRRK
jgi:hypothetical protein